MYANDDGHCLYAPIADITIRTRYRTLCQYLHVVDNTKKDEAQNKEDKIFKIRPMLEAMRNNCVKVLPVSVHSIDEQIIPTKTKTSGIRQYNPRKPSKWGFKKFVRAAESGYIYDFFLYTGKNSIGQ